MLKFNRVNIQQIANDNNIHYSYLDILRQTTIERLTTQNNISKKELIDTILHNTKALLDIMIKEVL